MKILYLLPFLCFILAGCYDEPDPNVAGSKLDFAVEAMASAGVAVTQYSAISSLEELSQFWEYNNLRLQQKNILQLPPQPSIDFSSREVVAIISNDQQCNSSTTINRVMELGKKVIVRLRREVKLSPVYCIIEGPILSLLSFPKSTIYDSRLYEIVYDCTNCDPEGL